MPCFAINLVSWPTLAGCVAHLGWPILRVLCEGWERGTLSGMKIGRPWQTIFNKRLPFLCS